MIQLHNGSCVDVLPSLASASVDCVITDPPYPCIKREYGTWTEAEWFALMRAVVPECMRVLKPTGSAVFILQPNSEKVGRMRTWLWEFMAWVGKEYGIVQDAWWWNVTARPTGGAAIGGLMRDSLKACVWAGPAACHRNQQDVLWTESESNRAQRLAGRFNAKPRPSDLRPGTTPVSVNQERWLASAAKRGGVTPFNVLPIPNTNSTNSAGAHGHGAGTPLALCSWWTRYICPPGGVVLDPFMGSGTTGIAAVQHGAGYVGIERIEKYHAIAQRRITEAQPTLSPGAA